VTRRFGYGVTLAVLGLANLFGLLIVVAHAVTLACLRRRCRVGRGLVRGWLIAVTAAVIVVSPVAVAGYGQLHQIHWLKPPGLKDVLSVQRVIGSSSLLFLLAHRWEIKGQLWLRLFIARGHH
jgi:uncharacterized membrane protein